MTKKQDTIRHLAKFTCHQCYQQLWQSQWVSTIPVMWWKSQKKV